ncbi:MAG: OmpH family outer membrane protein [Hylemonella sp.]
MNQFSRISGLALLLGGSVLFATAQAQEFRLGSVNVDRVMREAVQAKSAQAKLEQEFSRRDKELQEQGSSLKGMAEKFEREAPTLSESQRTARQRQLVDLDRDFQRKRREFQEDLNLRKNEELQQVLDRANRVVRQLADNEKYDLILNAQDIVYVNPRHDITDKVIRALNASK